VVLLGNPATERGEGGGFPHGKTLEKSGEIS